MNSGGLVRAIVVDNEDPDKLGRVRLSFPSLGDQGKALKSEWCRVVRPLAFGETGDWYLPEVGAEVMVGFEGGDVGFPVVLGCVLGEEAKPVAATDRIRAVKTRSGHTLVFDDTQGKESILLRDKSSNELLLSSEKKTIHLKDSHGNKIEMSDKGLFLESKSGAKIDIEGGTIKILAASKVEIGEGAAKSAVFGEELLQAFNNHTHMYMATMAAGVTNPPLVPMTPSVLSKKVKVS